MKKLFKRFNRQIFALAMVCMVAVATCISVSADETETEIDSLNDNDILTVESGRNVTTNYQFVSGDSTDSNSLYKGLLSNGNNLSLAYQSYSGQVGGDGEFVYNRWDIKHYVNYFPSSNVYPYDRYTLTTDNIFDVPNFINLTLTDFYLYSLVDEDSDYYVDDILFTLYQQCSSASDYHATLYFDFMYYDLFDVNSEGEIHPISVSGSYDPFDYNGETNGYTVEFNIYHFLDEFVSSEGLLYFEYFSLSLDLGVATDFLTSYIEVQYQLSPNVAFTYNGDNHILVSQSDFDSFRIYQFSKPMYDSGHVPSDVLTNILNVFSNVGTWIAQSVQNLIVMFYANGNLTFLGVLAVAGLAISVIFLMLSVIGNFLRFRG